MILDSVKAQHPALPDETRPTGIVGWLDRATVLVAAGGCGEPLDLSAVDAKGGDATPLVFEVDAAAVRAPAPKAPSTLPQPIEEDVGPGVA